MEHDAGDQPCQGLVAYAGYTKGLEDSGVAPEIAVNRSEAPPALLTNQRDFGIRYAFGPMRLVVGAFDVRKPYFNLDSDLFFTQLGTVRHRGVEISLAGEPIKGLNIVAGAILMKPRVSGEAVDQGLIGKKPVGQPERSANLYLDYRLPWDQKLSVNLGIQYLGKSVGSPDNELIIPGHTLVNLGGRYRFRGRQGPGDLAPPGQQFVRQICLECLRQRRPQANSSAPVGRHSFSRFLGWGQRRPDGLFQRRRAEGLEQDAGRRE